MNGLEVGNPEVLRAALGGTIPNGNASSQPLHEWGYAVTSARGPVTTVAFHLIRDWRQQWSEPSAPREPVLVDGAGSTTTSGQVLAELERRLAGHPADHHELGCLALDRPGT